MKEQPNIYKKLSVSTIQKWLKLYNIPRRESAMSLKKSIKKRTLPIPKREKLEELYLERDYSLNKMANLLKIENKEIYANLSSKTVKKWLNYYEIELK